MFFYDFLYLKYVAGVAELVDARDLKSLVGNDVPVQVRSPVPFKIIGLGFFHEAFSLCHNKRCQRLFFLLCTFPSLNRSLGLSVCCKDYIQYEYFRYHI